MLKTNKCQFEVFDSLGTSAKFVTQNIPYQGTCEFNVTPLQLESSNTCGQFCLYFIIHRLHNFDLTFDNFMNDFFTDEPVLNEARVLQFLSQ